MKFWRREKNKHKCKSHLLTQQNVLTTHFFSPNKPDGRRFCVMLQHLQRLQRYQTKARKKKKCQKIFFQSCISKEVLPNQKEKKLKNSSPTLIFFFFLTF